MTVDKIKILYVSHTSQTSGAESCLFNILKYLDKNKFEPIVVLPNDGPLKQKITDLDIKTLISPMHWSVYPPTFTDSEHERVMLNFMPEVEKLVGIIEKEGVDIVHTNTSVTWKGAFAAKIVGVPHVWHLHEILEGHPSLKVFYNLPTVYSLINIMSERIIVVSKAIEEKLLSVIPDEKITVIPNGIEVNKIQSMPNVNVNSIRQELGLKENDLLIGTVGNIVKEKGYDVFIEAARILRQKLSNVKFVAAGKELEKGLLELLKKTVIEKGLEGSFIFLGYRDDVPSILRDIDIFVNSSITEAAPLSVIEAMAAGKPIIASDTGGISEIVEDGVTGRLVRPGDPNQLADAMYRLLMNKEDMRSLSKAGSQVAMESYNIQKNVAMIERQYEQIVQAMKKDGRKPDPILTITADIICSMGKQLSYQNEQIIRQQEQIQSLRQFIDDLKGTSLYRLYRWFKKIR